MTQPLQTLLAAHPRAVAAIGLRPDHTKYTIATKVRDYANLNDVGDHAMDSVETLLGLIESKAAAEAPLSDEEIEGMRWRTNTPGGIVIRCSELWYCAGSAENAIYLITEQHKCIDRLHREIKRLRGGGK